MPEDIVIRPIGVVQSQYTDPKNVPVSSQESVVKIFPEYAEALFRIEENSHLWILTWFHLAHRDALSTIPYRVNPHMQKRGVFGLRSPIRPNPIALTLVQLIRVEGTALHVAGLDAVNNTPVLDVKPYFEGDIVFSPRTPHIRPAKREMQRNIFSKQALTHHQEECPGLLAAVRMAMLAEERLGRLNSPDLYITVEGPPCLADTLQGLSKARLANPSRFAYRPSDSPGRSIWRRGKKVLDITLKREIDRNEFLNMADSDIFDVASE